jgi:hypothetical protein
MSNGTLVTDWLRDDRWTGRLDDGLRARVDAVLPDAMAAAGGYPDPPRTARRTLDLLDSLAQRSEPGSTRRSRARAGWSASATSGARCAPCASRWRGGRATPTG